MLKHTEKLLKAVGDRTRLRILKMLEPGPLCVCQVVATLKLSQSTVSKHLSILCASELVEDESRGKWTFYRLAKPRAGEARRLLAVVRCCAGEDPEVARDLARVKGEKIRSLSRCCPPRRGTGKGDQ
jgi:ArsR family transcriptional regulator, arsenate/arsenite/antimonite-responsive transcriptional repressor